MLPGPARGRMSNLKKPKRAKAPVIHGATFASRQEARGGKLMDAVKNVPLMPTPKKK